MDQALKNIKVVDLTLAAAGPMCSKLLCQCGAECWLVEPVKGVSNRPMPQFGFMNGGKKSVPLDLKTSEGMALFHRMLAQADIFVSNYRTRSLKKLGLDYETLHRQYPGLIYATITGYGEKGPMKDEAGFDTTAFWGLTGLLQDIQERDGPLPVAPSSVGDTIAGIILTAGVCAALFQRCQTGVGTKVSTSLLQASLFVNFSQILFQQYGVEYPRSRLTPNRPLLNAYRCKDGYFMLTTLNWEKDFWNLLRAIGREDLVGDPRWTCMADTENEHGPELRAILDEAFGKLTLAEARERLKRVDMAFGPVLGSKEAMDHPQVQANGYLAQYTGMDGREVRAPVSPFGLGDRDPAPFQAGPELGHDAVEVLSKLGCSQKEIQSLAERGITVLE